MKIIAAKDFTLKGILYKEGEEIKPPKEYLIKLNEEGYIKSINIENIENYNGIVVDSESKEELEMTNVENTEQNGIKEESEEKKPKAKKEEVKE